MLTELAKMKHADSSSRPDLSLFQPLSCHIRLFRPELNQASAGHHEAAQPWTRRQTCCCHFRKKLSEIVEAETRDFGENFLLKNFSMPLKLMEIVSSIIGLERWLNWPSFDTVMSYSSKPKALSVKQQPLLLCDGILQPCKITTVITFRVEICKI